MVIGKSSFDFLILCYFCFEVVAWLPLAELILPLFVLLLLLLVFLEVAIAELPDLWVMLPLALAAGMIALAALGTAFGALEWLLTVSELPGLEY